MRICSQHLRCHVVFFYVVTSVAFVVTLAMLVKEYVKYGRDFDRPKRAHAHSAEVNHAPKSLQPLPKAINKISDNQTSTENLRCPKQSFDDILLIVALSTSYTYESIPLYELLYKGGFRHRMICGPKLLSNDSNISIDVVNTRNGAFLYDCLSYAVEKYSNYNGYLFVAEEILLNYWNFVYLDKSRIWQDRDVITGPALYTGTPDNWEWWASPWGMRALEKAFEYLVERSYGDNRKAKLLEGDWKADFDANKALNAWLWNSEGDYRAHWINKTILYLPKRHVTVYRKLAKIFRQSGVRHALAMPTIVRMLELDEESIKIHGRSLNDEGNFTILNDRNSLHDASQRNGFLFVNGGMKERRLVLNDLKLKEFAMGKFLYYDDCPD